MEYKGIYLEEKNGIIRLLNKKGVKTPKITIKLNKYKVILENYVQTLGISKIQAVFLFAEENYSRFCNFQNRQDFYRIITDYDLENNIVFQITHTNGTKYTFYDEKQLITCSKDYFNITINGKFFLEYHFGLRFSPNISETKIYWLPKEKRVV